MSSIDVSGRSTFLQSLGVQRAPIKAAQPELDGNVAPPLLDAFKDQVSQNGGFSGIYRQGIAGFSEAAGRINQSNLSDSDKLMALDGACSKYLGKTWTIGKTEQKDSCLASVKAYVSGWGESACQVLTIKLDENKATLATRATMDGNQVTQTIEAETMRWNILGQSFQVSS
ncbi:hypothetical protein IV102_17825 [bacterium]|nr:hypothetical protein [bacterium]